MIKQFRIKDVPTSLVVNDGRTTKVNESAATAIKQTFQSDDTISGIYVMTVISEKAKNYGSINSFKRDFQIELEDWSEPSEVASMEVLPEEVVSDELLSFEQMESLIGPNVSSPDDDEVEREFNAASDSSDDADEPVNRDDTFTVQVTDLKLLKASIKSFEAKNKGAKTTILVTGLTKRAKIVSAEGIKRPLEVPRTMIDAVVTSIGNKWMTVDSDGVKFFVKEWELGAHVTLS